MAEEYIIYPFPDTELLAENGVYVTDEDIDTTISLIHTVEPPQPDDFAKRTIYVTPCRDHEELYKELRKAASSAIRSGDKGRLNYIIDFIARFRKHYQL